MCVVNDFYNELFQSFYFYFYRGHSVLDLYYTGEILLLVQENNIDIVCI